MKIKFVLFEFLILINEISGYGISTGICYSGCALVVNSCYSAGGFVFGTVTAGMGIPAAIKGCNAAFGGCMSKCSSATSWLP